MISGCTHHYEAMDNKCSNIGQGECLNKYNFIQKFITSFCLWELPFLFHLSDPTKLNTIKYLLCLFYSIVELRIMTIKIIAGKLR